MIERKTAGVDWSLQLVVISRLASTPLPWVQCLSSKSVQLVIGKSQVRFPAGSLWIFLSLCPKLTSNLYSTQHWKLRSLDPSATATRMASGRLYKLESYMWRRTDNNDNLVLLWAKSGLMIRNNLRASNLQNFPGGAYPHTPPGTCMLMHTHKSLPPHNLKCLPPLHSLLSS